MTKLQVSFDGITDTTGYLFSLAKCFSAALKHSKYETYAEDIIAASGSLSVCGWMVISSAPVP